MPKLFLRSIKFTWLAVVLLLLTSFPSPTFAAVKDTNYSIIITMSDDTVNALQKDGYYLCAFKAVKTSAEATPVVWFSSLKYAENTEIDWSEHYQAYTSTSEIVSGGQIKASSSYDIDLGGLLNVSGQSGTGKVDPSGGTKGEIEIYNSTDQKFTSGMSQQAIVNGQTIMSPLCAFTLNGGFSLSMAPIEKVVLMFCTKDVNTGSVIAKSTSPGISIDMTGSQTKAITYDMSLDPEKQWKSSDANDEYIPSLSVLQNYLIFDSNSSIKVLSYNADASDTTDAISPAIMISNNGKTPIKLSDVKVHYYFSNDDVQDNIYKCYESSVNPEYVTNKITTIKGKEDRCLELGFTSDAGILKPGDSVKLFGKLYKADGSKFLQTNDYSFNPKNTDFAAAENVTGYIAGLLNWGVEP